MLTGLPCLTRDASQGCVAGAIWEHKFLHLLCLHWGQARAAHLAFGQRFVGYLTPRVEKRWLQPAHVHHRFVTVTLLPS